MSGPSAEGPVDRPDIVGFLRARLDEDEAAMVVGTCSCDNAHQHCVASRPDCINRVLREVEAKRRIVEWCACAVVMFEQRPGVTEAGGKVVADGVLRFMAAAEDQHPDYDPAWRPS